VRLIFILAKKWDSVHSTDKARRYSDGMQCNAMLLRNVVKGIFTLYREFLFLFCFQATYMISVQNVLAEESDDGFK
jgi:hypothetical protein